MLRLSGENNVLLAVLYDIFGSGSAVDSHLVRYPLHRNLFLLKPLALLRYHLERHPVGLRPARAVSGGDETAPGRPTERVRKLRSSGVVE